MTMIGPVEMPSADLYRLEASPQGDRLVPVETEAEATYVGLRRVQERLTTSKMLLTAAQARIQTLDTEIAEHAHRRQEAEARAQRLEHDCATHADAVRRLHEKNATIIGEKRRLQEILSGRVAIPTINRRIVIDQESGEAFGMEVIPLDAAAVWDQSRAAVSEARRLARTYGARLKEVRLDRVVWRAIMAISVDDPPQLVPRRPD